MNEISDPLRDLKKDIDEINTALAEKTKTWKEKEDSKMTDRAEAIHELGEIEDKIKHLRPKPVQTIHPQHLFKLDPDQVFHALMEIITVRGNEDPDEAEDPDESEILFQLSQKTHSIFVFKIPSKELTTIEVEF